MNDVLLITVDDLKEITSISKNIAPELLEPFLEISEESYCNDILGAALVSELKDQLTGNTITSFNQSLLVQFVRPLVAYGAWFEYVPFGAVKSMQKGEVRQGSDNSTVATMEEVVFKRNALNVKISFYQKRMKEYLESNKHNYPLYRSSCENGTGNHWNIYLGRENSE